MIPADLIRLALLNSGVISLSQTVYADDILASFNMLNTILNDWQVNRWLSSGLVSATHASSSAASYTVGPTGAFVFSDQRPDRIDAAYASSAGNGDVILYPFMSREGYDRLTDKTTTGIPQSYFYDPGIGTNGTIYFWPPGDGSFTYTTQAKASLGQLTSFTTDIALPAPYVTALLWNLAASIRGIYGQPSDPGLDAKAAASLQALVNSIAQVPQAVQPTPSDRGGIYSAMPQGGTQ